MSHLHLHDRNITVISGTPPGLAVQSSSVASFVINVGPARSASVGEEIPLNDGCYEALRSYP
jgi:hypothetical protein